MPCPPAAWSARLAWKRAWYSGVNGGCCAGPQAFAGSKTLPRPWPTPTVFAFGPRRHRPFKSGYFVSSNADAATIVDSSTPTSTDTMIEPRSNIAASSQSMTNHAGHIFEPGSEKYMAARWAVGPLQDRPSRRHHKAPEALAEMRNR